MTKQLPRVTYSNTGADFAPLHQFIDARLPEYRKSMLGRAWPNVVAGRQDVSGRAYEVFCPFDRELLVARLVAADKKAVKNAVQSAEAALPGWAGLHWKDRVKAMRNWAAEINKRKYDLALATLYEVGKSRIEAIGEAEEAVDLVEWYCDEMKRNNGFSQQMMRSVPNEETICVLKPVGVFAVISPFNFPVALPCNMLGACLIAGNTAVFKPSPGSGLTAALLLETADAAGLPSGVLNMLCGEEAGPLLVDHEQVDGVAFTGSHDVGMQIFRKLAAGPHARPVICEMGGKNPAYVTLNANLDVAVEGLVRSAFGLQGEKCSACSVAYVGQPIYEKFLTLLKAKTATLRVGNPEETNVFVGPVINEAAVESFERASGVAKQHGRIITGGERIRTGACAKGHFVQPTIVADLPPDHWISREELFLPFLSVHPMQSLAEGIACGNQTIYGVTAGIYSEDDTELNEFFRTADAGVLYANRPFGATTGAWPGFQTFCGWKGSGVDGKGGLGPYTIPRYMREQSITIMHRA